jgi:YHYH protein
VNAAYLLGHYIEDFDYLGDLGYTLGTHFDLNEQNVRYGVTPEYPAGTYAYFTTINADGTPAYPYTTGRQFYGNPTGGIVASIAEPVSTSFIGGPFTADRAVSLSGSLGTGGSMTFSWSGVEGGFYTVQATSSLQTWDVLATNTLIANGPTGFFTETGSNLATDKRFYRVLRTGLATYDRNGFAGTTSSGNLAVLAPGGSAERGTVIDLTITLTAPPTIPANALPTSVTLAGSISGSNFSRPSATQVKATFTIPANTSLGAQTLVVTFPGPTFTLSGALTIQ